MRWASLVLLLGGLVPRPAAAQVQAPFLLTLPKRDTVSVGDTAQWLPRLRRDGVDSLRFIGFRTWWFLADVDFDLDSVDVFRKDGAILQLDRRGKPHAISLSWGIGAIQADSVCTVYGLCGVGVTVGIIDTGSGPNTDLPILGGQNVTDFPPSANYSDCEGHGTHTAGTVAGKLTGVAPFASLFIERAASTSGCLIYLSGTFVGLQDACTRKMVAVNISLGYGVTNALDPVVQSATDCGVVVVAAAANDGSSNVQSPASAPGAVAVCAWDGSGRAGFSNYGPRIDLCGPGVNITSTMPNNQYGSMSGTSMASPHIAGVMALLKSWCGSCSRDSLVKLACVGALPVDQGGCGVPQLLPVFRAMSAAGFPTVDAGQRTITTTSWQCEAVGGSKPFRTVVDVSWLAVRDSVAPRKACYQVQPSAPPGGVAHFQVGSP